MTDFKMSLSAVTLETANDYQKPLLESPLKSMGMIPNMYANMVNSPGLMETYAVGYERFRKFGGFTPIEQEVVFLTISIANECSYCVAAHSFVADMMSKLPKELTDTIRNEEKIGDPKLSALAEFTKVLFFSRGNPSKSEVKAFIEAGFEEKQILEIILAIAVKTLSNYSNHIFHTEIDPVFGGRKWTKSETVAG